MILLLAYRMAPFSCHCFSLGLSLGSFSTQILFVVVLFSLVFCNGPFIGSVCFFFAILFYSFFYPAEWFRSFYHLFWLILFFWLCSSHSTFPGVGDTCHSLWQGDFTRNRKQVVNRLKIPQGLSTLLFHRWSEVPSRGGVRGDSP